MGADFQISKDTILCLVFVGNLILEYDPNKKANICKLFGILHQGVTEVQNWRYPLKENIKRLNVFLCSHNAWFV